MSSLHVSISRPTMISCRRPHLSIGGDKPLSFSLSRRKPNPTLIKLRLGAAGKPKCGASDWGAQGLEPESIPKHVAVILDGNRRWARNGGLSVQLGHRAGREAMKQLITNCKKYGVRVLSVFSFSTENWARPQEEVDGLMDLFEDTVSTDLQEIIGDGTRLLVVGNRSQLRKSLQHAISAAEEITKDNKRMTFVMAINYGGRYDITEATRRMARKVKDGVLKVEDIDDDTLEQHLDTDAIECFPNPDLLIRTSGELRVSNFMLWQLAYTHKFFTKKLIPDFDEAELVRAFTAFLQAQKSSSG